MNSHQLLYLLYGNQDVYRQEAKFSILSALRQQCVPASFTITVMTDQPQAFEGWPVTVIALDAETLTQWQGVHGYTHRRKACAIAEGVKLADKTLFVDTDTVFFKDPAQLFSRITEQQYLMDEFEWTWAQAKHRPDYVAFAHDLSARGMAPDDRMKLYNSGLCGIARNNGGIMDGVIQCIDDWKDHYGKLHTIEQIAVSFAMGQSRVVTAHDCVNHYYAKKRYYHAMNRGFFDKHGEHYHPALPRLSAKVPVFFPDPSLLAKIKALPRLLRVEPPFKAAAKLIIHGHTLPLAPDLRRHCQLALWRRAIELLLLKHATPAQIEHVFEACGGTPQQQARFRQMLGQVATARH